MPTAPTSSAGKARGYLRDMIAASSTFQGWVDADDADGAKASIHYESLPLPGSSAEVYSAAEIAAYWPYALIYLDEYHLRPMATESDRDGGAFVVQFCALAEDSSNDPDETTVKFENHAMNVLEEIMALREQAGYLDVGEVQVIEGPVRAHPDDIAAGGRDELTLTVRFPWGV